METWARRMGVPNGGNTTCQRTAWEAMVTAESEQRYIWGVTMRWRHGFGEQLDVWHARAKATGYWRRLMLRLGEEDSDDSGSDSDD